eukprot:c5226_g1_i1.p1 GENE.c5226_g1_i1~~c5226_g1_i1.p1  ORF type:complete len:545 (-),score=151.69 c5226_g1_i1:323-1957(-)
MGNANVLEMVLMQTLRASTASQIFLAPLVSTACHIPPPLSSPPLSSPPLHRHLSSTKPWSPSHTIIPSSRFTKAPKLASLDIPLIEPLTQPKDILSPRHRSLVLSVSDRSSQQAVRMWQAVGLSRYCPSSTPAAFLALLFTLIIIEFAGTSINSTSHTTLTFVINLCWTGVFVVQLANALRALHQLVHSEDQLQSRVVNRSQVGWSVAVIAAVSAAELVMLLIALFNPAYHETLIVQETSLHHVMFTSFMIGLVYVIMHGALVLVLKIRIRPDDISSGPAMGDCLVDFHLIRLGQLVGRGSNAQVYFGEYAGSPVAIKAQRILYLTDLQAVINEAMFLVRLCHPHVVRFHAVSLQKPYCYTITERCDYSVDDLIKSPTAFRWRDVALQISLGMEFIHSLGVIHRDLKPANVLLSGGIVKICDLGTAKFFSDFRNTARLGTPAFMAPELYVGDSETDYTAAVDVYSFGIILWMLITRKMPLEELQTSNSWELLAAVKRGTRPPHLPSIPHKAYEMMSECWAPEPELRPSFTDIKTRLQAMALPDS